MSIMNEKDKDGELSSCRQNSSLQHGTVRKEIKTVQENPLFLLSENMVKYKNTALWLRMRNP